MLAWSRLGRRHGSACASSRGKNWGAPSGDSGGRSSEGLFSRCPRVYRTAEPEVTVSQWTDSGVSKDVQDSRSPMTWAVQGQPVRRGVSECACASVCGFCAWRGGSTRELRCMPAQLRNASRSSGTRLASRRDFGRRGQVRKITIRPEKNLATWTRRLIRCEPPELGREAQPQSFRPPPLPAVTEPVHQSGPCGRDSQWSQAGIRLSARRTESGERWHHQAKAIRRVQTVRRGVTSGPDEAEGIPRQHLPAQPGCPDQRGARRPSGEGRARKHVRYVDGGRNEGRR